MKDPGNSLRSRTGDLPSGPRLLSSPPGPSGGDVVEGNMIIPKGETVILNSSVNTGLIKVEGNLLCPQNEANLEIITDGIVVAGPNAEFRCGTPSSPFRGMLTIKLKGNRDISEIYGSLELGPKAIVAIDSGVINMHGAPGKEGFQYLQATAKPNDTQITVLDASGWEIGDLIVIAPTNFDPYEAEERSVADISSDGMHITLDAPLTFEHWGSVQHYQNGKGQNWDLDERAEVFNLNRNVRILSLDDGSTIKGGHMIVRGGGSAYIDNVELYRMGQSGLMGRYPFHWHVNGDVVGQYIKNSSIHKSFQRCVVVHQTNYATVEGNTCFDHFGHGYFLEDGNEVKNRIVNNLGVLSKKPAPENALLASDIGNGQNLSRFPSPSTFWISHPDNIVKGNTAVASEGSGFWMPFVSTTRPGVSPPAAPLSSNTLVFDDNVAHSCLVGITHDGAPDGGPTGNMLNANDRAIMSAHYRPSNVPMFNNLVAYKCAEAGIYFRGSRAIYKNAILADNKMSAFFAFDQELVNTLIVGVSQNLPPNDGKTRHFTGVPVYDGPFFLDTVHFAGFSGLPELVTASAIDLLFGGFEVFTNQVRSLTFDGISPQKIQLIHKKSNWADSYGASVRDIDGSLTGSTNSTVVPNHPMTDDSRCTAANGGDSTLVCAYDLGYLRIRDDTNSNGQHLGFTVTRQNSKTGGSAFFSPPENSNNNKFPIIFGDEYEYVVSDLQLRDGQRYTLHFSSMDIGMTSPIIEFRGASTSCRIQYDDGKTFPGTWSSGSSLFAELESKDAPAHNRRPDTFRGQSTFELICLPRSKPPPDDTQPDDSLNPLSLCFSSINTVEVQGKGPISMDSLKIGDYVRAGKNQFSRVFGFLHLDRDVEAEYLQIHLEGFKTPLEVSLEHMVFVENAAVRASHVKVGDMLGENMVSDIKSVKRRGVYAPVTESGDIVVSGALASSYAAVLPYSPVNQHLGAHAFFATRRLVCAVNFGICESETYTDDGFPDWLSPTIHFALSAEQNITVSFFASFAALPFIAAVYMSEQMIYNPFLVSIIILGLFICKRNKKFKVKIVGDSVVYWASYWLSGFLLRLRLSRLAAWQPCN